MYMLSILVLILMSVYFFGTSYSYYKYCTIKRSYDQYLDDLRSEGKDDKSPEWVLSIEPVTLSDLLVSFLCWLASILFLLYAQGVLWALLENIWLALPMNASDLEVRAAH